MKKNSKKSAFGFAELIIVLTAIAIVAVLGMKAGRDKTTQTLNKLMYYSAYDNLNSVVAEIVADGCTTADTQNTADVAATLPVCSATTGQLPMYGNTNSSRGLCQRVTDMFNTIGTVDCSLSATDATDFKTVTPNFKTTNGMRFYNFGGAVPVATGGTPIATPLPVDGTTTTGQKKYTLYVDIDGKKRDGKLNVDVMKFFLENDKTNSAWIFYPDPVSTAANNTVYMSAGVRYPGTTDDVWVGTGMTYFDAVCTATGAYFTSGATCTKSKAAACSSNTCEVVIAKPNVPTFGQ